jgi:hypothetical protein
VIGLGRVPSLSARATRPWKALGGMYPPIRHVEIMLTTEVVDSSPANRVCGVAHGCTHGDNLQPKCWVLNVLKSALSTLAAKDGCSHMQTWAVEATEKNLELSEEILNIALDVPRTRCMQMGGNN